MIKANDGNAGAPNEAASHMGGTMVNAGYPQLLLRELERRKLDPRAQLAAHGIGALERPTLANVAGSAQLAAFLQVVEELARDPTLGLHAGARIELQDLGLVGLLLRASRDGWCAHSCYERFRDLLPYASDLEVSIRDRVILSHRPRAGAARSRILSDCFLACAVSCMRLVFGPVELLEVRLMQARPADHREHVRMLGERLRFEQAEDALVLPVEVLSRALPHRDPMVADVLERHLARGPTFASALSGDLIGRVLWAIREELAHGHASTSSISSRLNLSERTLRRHLSQHGTGFQKLLDEVRRDQALRHLRAAKCTGSELGARLGFKGEAAFCRAFRRWTGTSLTEYRARQTSTRAVRHAPGLAG